MSTIVECLDAEVMHASNTIMSTITDPVPLGSEGVASISVFHGLQALFDSEAEASNEITDAIHQLLSVQAAMSVSLHSVVTARQLVGVSATMSCQVLSLLVDQVEVSGEASVTAIQRDITSRIGVTAAATNAILPGQTLYNLAGSTGNATAQILSTFYERVIGVSAVATNTIVAPQRIIDLLGSTAQMSISVLQHRVTHDLLGAGALAVASIIGRAEITDLLSAEAFAEAFAVDGIHSGITAWSAPTDSFGMTRYTLPALNSIAATKDALFLFGPDGVFRRGGTTDDGEPIAARVMTGLTDFSSPDIKRGDKLYVGYTSSDTVVVFVGETTTGSERTWRYALPPRVNPATSATAGRFGIGRGIETRYFRLTFANEDGCELALFGAQIDYLTTKRKI